MDKANKIKLRVGIFLIIFGLLMGVACAILLALLNNPLWSPSEVWTKSVLPALLVFLGGWISFWVGTANIVFVFSVRKEMRRIENLQEKIEEKNK